MRLFYRKLRNYLFVIFSLMLFNFCSFEEKKNFSDTKCFCDSTYFNKNEPNVKEFLCYKKNKCYKLVVKGTNYKLTEHYILNPNFSYQSLITENGKTIDSISNCLVLNQFTKSIAIKYIGPKVDSLNVYFLNIDNIRTRITKVLSNDFTMPFKYFYNDSQRVVIDVFFSRYLEFEGKKGNVLTKRTLEFSSFKDLKQNSFDKILLQTTDCMKESSR
jgi:hypothetical protein